MLDGAAPALAQPGAPARVVVLGVTPQIMQLEWDGATELIATDSSETMIDAWWAPHPRIPSRVIHTDWSDLPLADASVAVAAGDASFNSLPSLDDYDRVLAELARVVRPGGVLVMRFFVKDEPVRSPAEIVAAAMRGEFANCAVFRLLFLMALSGEDSVLGFSDIPANLEALVPDRDRLIQATGWPREDIDLFDTDRDSPIRMTFPSQPELRQRTDRFFEWVAIDHGTYAQAQSCPTITFRRRA
jgi:SAM-dependent methyltransferase